MFNISRALFVVFLLVLIIGSCNRGPEIERINIDTSKTITTFNAYGQPDTVYSNNGYPIIKYIWDGAFIDKLIANYYFTNTGNYGDCEFIVSIIAERKRIFKLKANKSYILRILVKEFGSTLYWERSEWEKYVISIKANGIEDQITFSAPVSLGYLDQKTVPLDFNIFLADM